MPAGTHQTIVVSGALADRGWSRREALPYGEVRIGPGEITIGVESVATLSATQRSLYEQAVAAAGVDPANVLVVHLAEVGVEVDALDEDDVHWPVRTVRVAAASMPSSQTATRT